MPAADYGAALPPLTVNLIVRDVAAALPFYRDALGAIVRHADEDFAALVLRGVDVMLHADHTYEHHPWREALATDGPRGVGAELRLFGVDPDAIAARTAAAGGVVLAPAVDKPHGWREAWIADGDGYVWAVGRAIPSA